MPTTAKEYQKAQDDLRQLEERLSRLQQTSPLGAKGFTREEKGGKKRGRESFLDTIFQFPTFADQLHDDFLRKRTTDNDYTGFGNDLEKGASVNEVPKTASMRVFLHSH